VIPFTEEGVIAPSVNVRFGVVPPDDVPEIPFAEVTPIAVTPVPVGVEYPPVWFKNDVLTPVLTGNTWVESTFKVKAGVAPPEDTPWNPFAVATETPVTVPAPFEFSCA
jgi:hypothetical protein